MKVECPKCRKTYNIADEKVAAIGRSFVFPCPSCRENIRVALPKTKSNGAYGSELKNKILKSVEDFPPLPQVAQKARSIISDPNSSFSDLAKVIETDQSIVTKVLRIANSPYYGMSGKVSSVQHASVVLGIDTLMELLTLACSVEVLAGSLDGYGLDAGDMWRHSLCVASGAQILAEERFHELAGDAFTAGLMHDVGKVILDKYIVEREDEFQAQLANFNNDYLLAEKEVLGFDHAQLAGSVCVNWKIPPVIAEGIKFHHRPGLSEENDLAWILNAADLLAKMDADSLEDGFDADVLEHLGIERAELPDIKSRMEKYADGIISGM